MAQAAIRARNGPSTGVTAWFAANDPSRSLRVAVLSSKGRILSRLDCPDASITDLVTRLCFSPDGRLFQLVTNESGIVVREWPWNERKPARPDEAKKGGVR